MMKNVLLTTAIATCLASTAFAGALEYTPVAEPEMAAPAVTDWSGPYVGVLFATGNATQDFEYDENGEYQTFAISTRSVEEESGPDLEGAMYGAFAGYNVQRGSYVFGVEGAYSTGSFSWSESISETEWGIELTNIIDLKARAGIVAGDALIYGFAGWSMGDYRAYSDGGYDETFDMDGMNYGVGADFLVTDSIFVGAEYIVRDLSSVVSPFSTMNLGVQALELRVGMKF